MQKKYNPESDAPSDEASLTGAGLLALGTLGSRLLGFARDVLIAWLLGPGADFFLPAFRVPNIFRRLLAEGSLGLAYGAASARVRASYGVDGFAAFGASVAVRVSFWACVAALLLALAAEPLLHVLAPGLSAYGPDGMEQAVRYMRLCLPYLPLSLFCAIAFSHAAVSGDLRPQAFGPALFNVAVIACGSAALAFTAIPGLFASEATDFSPEYLLCAGVVLGGLIQAIWGARQLPLRNALSFPTQIARTDHPYTSTQPNEGVWGTACPPAGFQGVEPLGRRRHSSGPLVAEIRAFIRALPLGILGAAPHQLHALVGMALASLLAQGGMTALYFAERLIELPLGVIGAAIGMAALPGLASMAASGRYEDFSDALGDCIRLSAFFSLPATAGLLALAVPLTDMLFGHGAFEHDSVSLTASVLQGYALGLPALCAARPLLAAAHALQQGKAPLRAAFASLGLLALITSAALLFGESPTTRGFGLGLGLAAGAWCNFRILLHAVKAAGTPSPIAGIARVLFLYAVASMGLTVVLSALPLGHPLWLLSAILLCAFVWIGGFALAGNRDARFLLRMLRS